jgi:hypothetical protein
MTCRCYEDVTFGHRACGVKKGDLVIPSPPDCCPGGCEGDTPVELGKMYNIRILTRLALCMFIIGVLLLIYLKTFSVSKV